MIPCPSCTSSRTDCWLQESTVRRGQLQCPQCWRYFVFIARELLELDEDASRGFHLLDPAHSMFKRRNLLIAAGIADPVWHEDPQRREADLRELEQLRAGDREGNGVTSPR